MKNSKTIIGVLLIAALFWWSTHNAQKQQEKMQQELGQQKVIQKVKEDSLKAIKATKTLETPELVALPSEADSLPMVKQQQADVQAIETDSAVSSPKIVLPRTIVVRTENFQVSLDNRGAMVRSVIPFDLADQDGHFPEIIQNPEDGLLGLELDKTDFSQALFSVDSLIPDTVVVKNPLTIAFVWNDKQGRQLERLYSFTPEGKDFRHVTRVHHFQPKVFNLYWKGGMRETEMFPKSGGGMFGGVSYFFSEFILNNGFNVLRENPDELTWYNKDQGHALWAGLRRKYIAGIINWDGEMEASIGAQKIELPEPDPGTYSLVISDHMTTDSLALNFVVLPLHHSEIQGMGEGYEKIIFSGWEWIGADKWFVWLAGFVLRLLNVFYGMIPNYGIAIILLTLVIKLVTMPLTLKQLKATRDMQKHKPAIDALRVKYRSSPQKMQQELMAYYQRNGVNPFGAMLGCFPMLLQMPVFISLFVVLGRAVELRGAPFMGWIMDLSRPDVIFDGITIPFLMPQGVTILPFIMAFTTFFQTKQTVTDPNQKAMVYMMPIMMLFFSSVMPSGLIVYWIVSNLFSIVQYMVINKGHLLQPQVEVVAETPRSKR